MIQYPLCPLAETDITSLRGRTAGLEAVVLVVLAVVVDIVGLEYVTVVFGVVEDGVLLAVGTFFGVVGLTSSDIGSLTGEAGGVSTGL